jgi:uncharacterized protein YdhG (YjbR/CyaY superfamily)
MKNAVDDYIETFAEETQLLLQELRSIIKKAAPQAEEVISYKMPAYKQNGVLVYFAGYKNHVGFYPTSTGIENFSHEFGKYKWSKGAVQFPLNEKLPKALIIKIVKHRIEANSEK